MNLTHVATFRSTTITIFDDTDRELPPINSNFTNLFEKLNAMVAALDCDARVHTEYIAGYCETVDPSGSFVSFSEQTETCSLVSAF